MRRSPSRPGLGNGPSRATRPEEARPATPQARCHHRQRPGTRGKQGPSGLPRRRAKANRPGKVVRAPSPGDLLATARIPSRTTKTNKHPVGLRVLARPAAEQALDEVIPMSYGVRTVAQSTYAWGDAWSETTSHQRGARAFRRWTDSAPS